MTKGGSDNNHTAHGPWDIKSFPISDQEIEIEERVRNKKTPVVAICAALAQQGLFFFFSSRRRHTRSLCDWSSDVCSSDLDAADVRRGNAFQPARPPGGAKHRDRRRRGPDRRGNGDHTGAHTSLGLELGGGQIGRASCRERV